MPFKKVISFSKLHFQMKMVANIRVLKTQLKAESQTTGIYINEGTKLERIGEFQTEMTESSSTVQAFQKQLKNFWIEDEFWGGKGDV